MGVAEIAIILTITSFLTLALLHYYGNYKTSQWYSIVTGFISWVFPISVIFILPLDLSSVKSSWIYHPIPIYIYNIINNHQTHLVKTLAFFLVSLFFKLSRSLGKLHLLQPY